MIALESLAPLFRVDECLRVKLFCSLATGVDAAAGGKTGGNPDKGKNDPKSAKAKAAGKKDDKKKPAPKVKGAVVAEEATLSDNAPKLEAGEQHMVGEALVRLRDAFDARRTKEFRWYSLSDLSKGGAGMSCFSGQVGLHIETVDFSAARTPKPPPEVAHAECQTDLALERAARKAVEKAAQQALPRKKSRFAEKMMADEPPIAAKPSLGLNVPYADWRVRQAEAFNTAPEINTLLQPIASKYDHLYDFDRKAVVAASKMTRGEQYPKGEQEVKKDGMAAEEAHWQTSKKMQDILLGVPGAQN